VGKTGLTLTPELQWHCQSCTVRFVQQDSSSSQCVCKWLSVISEHEQCWKQLTVKTCTASFQVNPNVSRHGVKMANPSCCW
jgi:hypothetical protein